MKKKILLLGAGHAHIQLLHLLSGVDRSLFELILISDQMHSSYSGMIPSFLAGYYSQNQLQFDLQKICDRYHYTFIKGEATAIQISEKKVQISNGNYYDYDICSINIGIKTKSIPSAADSKSDVIYLKPISELISKWDQIIQRKTAPASLTIIGGGSAAFEIAVACRRRFNDLTIPIKIITGQSELLHEETQQTKNRARQSLQKLHIDIIEKVRVEKIESEYVFLSDGRKLSKHICLVGTSAKAPAFFKESGLPVNDSGFIQVDQYLNVLGLKNIFAAGDCCDFTPHPLPKAGVYAVREGPLLARNIISLLKDENKLKAYIPQSYFLKILITGKNEALATYKNLSFRGWLAWRLKDYIDKSFMTRFQ